MPVLNLTEDEAELVVDALMNERSKLMKNRSRLVANAELFYPEGHKKLLSDIAVNVVALARVRQRLLDFIKYEEIARTWHREHGWLLSKKVDEAVKADVEAVCQTRKKVAEAMGYDLDEIDAENARDRVRQKLNDAGFYKCAMEQIAENVTGEGITQDQMSPGTWTTLPDEVEVDAWPHEDTDPEEKIVIASADTQTDGTVVGFHTFPTEDDKSVNDAIWALITRNFSLVSERDIQLAEKVMRSDPSVLDRIRSSVDDLQKVYGDDRKYLVNIEIDGKAAELKVDGRFLKMLNDLN